MQHVSYHYTLQISCNLRKQWDSLWTELYANFISISSKNRFLHMQITAESMGVYTKVFSLSLYQSFDVIRQWSVQWCLMARPACLLPIRFLCG